MQAKRSQAKPSQWISKCGRKLNQQNKLQSQVSQANAELIAEPKAIEAQPEPKPITLVAAMDYNLNKHVL